MTEQRGSFVEWLATKQNEPKVITVERFVCRHCNRGHSKRKAAVEHIARCFKNPALRGCKTCRFLDHDLSEPEVGYVGVGDVCNIHAIDLSAGLRTGCPKWEAAS
jgi:hypothetical protein